MSVEISVYRQVNRHLNRQSSVVYGSFDISIVVYGSFDISIVVYGFFDKPIVVYGSFETCIVVYGSFDISIVVYGSFETCIVVCGSFDTSIDLSDISINRLVNRAEYYRALSAISANRYVKREIEMRKGK